MSAAVTLPANLAEGRWVGRFYEQPCLVCGCMLAMREPMREGVRCASCRAEEELSRVQQTIADQAEERNAWKGRALRAEHQLSESCDVIAEQRETIATLQAMLERLTTGSAREPGR
jgi:hypothetical protein